jgi:hypothetical protein
MTLQKQLIPIREALKLQRALKTIDASTCTQLSIDIFLKNGDYVSRSTLMQLFDLLPLREECFPPKIIEILCEYTKISVCLSTTTPRQNPKISNYKSGC